MSQEFDFNSVPSKLFIDTVNVRVINGLLHLALQSGQTTSCFLLPLPAAKMIAKAITKQVEEIEEKNNIKFDDRLPNEPMLSPWTSKNEGGAPEQK
ncbi:MAG: hypothetical protein V4449_03205 [Patescibacteria group bacterium]